MNQIQKHLATELLHKSDNNTANTTHNNNYLFLQDDYFFLSSIAF